jgi:hypothetical protein
MTSKPGSAGHPPDANTMDAAPPPVTCKQQRPRGSLKIITYNSMGGTTAEAAIRSLMQHQPDALILPELKISPKQQRRNLYRRLLGAKAGVLIAVAKKHAAHSSLSKPGVPAHLTGHQSRMPCAAWKPPARNHRSLHALQLLRSNTFVATPTSSSAMQRNAASRGKPR